MTKLEKICDNCEEQPAELRISVTDMNGIVLDSAIVCRDCFNGQTGSILSIPHP